MAQLKFEVMGKALVSHLVSNREAYPQFSVSALCQKNMREIFASVWDLEKAHQLMTPVFIMSNKSKDKADKLRIKGNEYYREKSFEKAIELYNRSIMIAPHPVLTKDTSSYCKTVEEDEGFAFPRVDPARYGGVAKGESNSLAKGFANRSAIMYELNLYDKCLHDIALALEYGYPEELQAKLHERKQKCLEAQQTSNSSNDSNPEVQGLSHLTLQESNIEEINPQQSSGTPTLRDRLSSTPQRLPVLPDQNKRMPSISGALKMSVTSDKGRGLFAVRDIHPGEVLCVERAYSVNIVQDKLTVRCSYCLVFCLTPLPCPGCTKVMFCSESCRVQSLAEEHWLECKILPTIISLDLLKVSFAYKLWKSVNFSQLQVLLCQLQEEEQDEEAVSGFNSKGVYDSTSYQTVHHLHGDDQFVSGQLLAFYQIVFVIVKVLEQSGIFFINDSGEAVTPSREDVLLTGTLLLSHSCKIIQNGYRCGDDEHGVYGRAIFPISSLFNHSCNPSVLHFPYDRTIVLRAKRPILAGEEATISYCLAFEDQELKQRKISLEKYCFVCRCEACEGKWPTFEDVGVMRFKCVVCKQAAADFTCDGCQLARSGFAGSLKEMKGIIATSERVADKIENNALISGNEFRSFCEDIEFLYDHYAMPCRYLIDIGRFMERCLRAGV